MSKIIKKFDGNTEKFDINKLKSSLKNAGALKSVVDEVADYIHKKIKDGDSTADIYSYAHNKLKEIQVVSSMKYSLRRSIFQFGPTGFPFEKFIGNLFYRLGYDIATNVYIQGKCVEHEVDVFLSGKENVALEVKFHNKFSIRTDLKVALYVHSRFNDLLKAKAKNKIDKGILVTNTKFTSIAVKYAECSNLNLLGWSYPEKGSLQELIEDVHMHPITSLSSLGKKDAKILFENNILTCRDFVEQKSLIKNLINNSVYNVLFDEAKSICL